MRRLLITLLVIGGGIFFFSPSRALADHQVPERVVEGKYVVSLLPTFDDDGKGKLKFFFTETRTGKRLSTPIRLSFTIKEEGSESLLFRSGDWEITQGVGEYEYTFPHRGIYELQLEFVRLDEPGKVLRPGYWSLWIPGIDTGKARYPIGMTEIAGFSLLFLALMVVAFNLWQRKMHRGKKGKE